MSKRDVTVWFEVQDRYTAVVEILDNGDKFVVERKNLDQFVVRAKSNLNWFKRLFAGSSATTVVYEGDINRDATDSWSDDEEQLVAQMVVMWCYDAYPNIKDLSNWPREVAFASFAQ